jgi:soluble lytic murein transglycosylase-like protein
VVLAALASAGLADTHVVGPGENLWTIAHKYLTTPRALAETNHIADADFVQIGTLLRIPGLAPSAAAPATPRAVTHVIARGENLATIAARYNVRAATLASMNGISDPNLVRIGLVLRIPVAAPSTVESLLERYSAAFKVDPALVKALAWQESGWQQHVVSTVGAVGVMQIMPGTGLFTGLNLLQHDVNPANLRHNVEAGVAFLAYLLSLTKGDQRLAVAGYYQGLRSIRTVGMMPGTKRYVADVMALKRRFSK